MNTRRLVIITLESISPEGRVRTAIEEVVSPTLKERVELKEAVLIGSKARGDDDKSFDADLLLITSQSLYW